MTVQRATDGGWFMYGAGINTAADPSPDLDAAKRRAMDHVRTFEDHVRTFEGSG